MLSKKREEPVQRLTGLKASAQWGGDTRKDEPPIRGTHTSFSGEKAPLELEAA